MTRARHDEIRDQSQAFHMEHPEVGIILPQPESEYTEAR